MMSENGLSSLKSSIDARLGLSSRAQHFVIASAVLCHRECSTLSSRTERNVPSGYGDLVLFSCHREERGDLGRSGLAHRERRDCSAGYPVIARNEAISVVRGWRTEKGEIAPQVILSSRGTKRSRLSTVSKRIKERLLRRLAMTVILCHRERSVAISPLS